MLSSTAARSHIDELLASDRTLPTWLYADEAIFRLEMEQILSKSWQYLVRAEAVASPGDFATGQVGEVPVVVTRDKQGELHAFVNLCRHRMFRVAEGQGRRSTLQCRYHGWTYGLNGKLRAAPRCPAERRDEFADIELLPVAVDIWNDMVFVNPDMSPDRPTLSEALGGLIGLAEQRGFNLGDYNYVATESFDHLSNWKISTENALECYHCPLVHKASFGNAFEVAEDTYLLHNFPNGNVAHFADIKNGPARGRTRPDSDTGFQFYYLWPSTLVTVDGYVGTVVYLKPTAVDRTEFVVEFYAHPDVDDYALADWTDMWTVTFGEDQEIVAGQQEAYRSGRVPVGQLLPGSESSLQAFQRRTWFELAPHLESVGNGRLEARLRW